MIEVIHPAFIFIFGALIFPLFRQRKVKQFLQLFIPAVAFIDLLYMTEGTYWIYRFMTYELILGRVDKLSMCFAYGFVIITFLGMVYALHVREDVQHMVALIYAGGTLGVTFAGDLFTLFAFWEVMAIFSVFLIWTRQSSKSLGAGFRYLMVHLFGGASLLAGIAIHVSHTGSILFTNMEFGTLGSNLILLGFLINAATPPLHAWLSDAYPEATVTGIVFLSAFTTKCAVYVLLRGFPGLELLVWMGAIMALYGIIYAILENDIRRLLAYHIISQVGYMLCGIGLGTELSMNGATAHALTNILNKSILLMAAGGIIEVTGRRKLTELQGRNLYTKMAICFFLYMTGAFSISGVPLFNGFISKLMVVYAAGEVHRPIIHLLLHLASIGTFMCLALKLPYNTWFGKAPKETKLEEIEAKEPPFNMLLAMAMAAFLCIFTGIYPKVLYDILPYPVTFKPYTLYSVATTLQLLLFTAFAFFLFVDKMRSELTISIDTDWFYRKGAIVFIELALNFGNARTAIQNKTTGIIESVIRSSKNPIQTLEALFLQRKTPSGPYDANTYRQAIGVGVMFFLILFALLCFVFFVY